MLVQAHVWRMEKEIDDKNRPLTDEELDALFPPGYKVYGNYGRE